MKTAGRIPSLLAEASAGRGAILSRGEIRVYEKTSVSELRRQFQEVGRHRDSCRGGRSRDIFGNDSSTDLGQAPAWVDAGAVYEELIRHEEQLGSLDYVFCLDPWVAQLRGKAGEAAGAANWVLVSDLAERQTGSEKEYWTNLDGWFKSLSFSEIIPRKEWDEAIGCPTPAPTIRPSATIYAQKPGAWQWQQVTRPTTTSLLLLVRYSGSLAHLRVLLDSLMRQEGPLEQVHCVLLKGSGGEDPGPFLKWFGVAHPDLPLSVLLLSEDWKAPLDRYLADAAKATVVMVGDHSILPLGFTKKVLEHPGAPVQGALLGLEASAHILTGNLDPHSNYEVLLQAAVGQQERRTDCARILPPGSWARGSGDAVTRLFDLARREPVPSSDSPSLWLELADLP